MGQRIEIDETRMVDDSMIVSTDRNFTGTDGEGYESADNAEGVDTFGAKAAGELFASDESITRVYVSSNVFVIRRDGGWTDDATTSVRRVIEEFFLFYPDA